MQYPTAPTLPASSGRVRSAATVVLMSSARSFGSAPFMSTRARSRSAPSYPSSTRGASRQNRSGASTTNPSSAYWSATARMWRFTPKISWKSTRPGPLPAGGSERYAPYLPPLVAATSIHWEVMAILVEGSGKEFGKRFGALRIGNERGILRGGNLVRIVVLAEAPGDRRHHVGGGEVLALQPRPGARHHGLELRERGVRLADDAVQPRLVELLLRPLLLLVDDRHALVGGRQGEADDVQGAPPRIELRGQEPALHGQRRLHVVEDQRRIH